MKALLVFAFLLLASPALCDIWTSCGTASDDLTLQSVTITPDPPVKNSNISVAIVGTLKKAITSGTTSIKLKYGIIEVVNKQSALCSEVTCPITEGAWKYAISELIPSDVPSGSYTGQATVTNQAGGQVACINLAFKL